MGPFLEHIRHCHPHRGRASYASLFADCRPPVYIRNCTDNVYLHPVFFKLPITDPEILDLIKH